MECRSGHACTSQRCLMGNVSNINKPACHAITIPLQREGRGAHAINIPLQRESWVAMSSPCTISPVAMPSPYTIYCIYSSYRCKWPFPCPLHGMRMWPCHHHSPLDTMEKCPSLSPFREMGKVAITIPLSMMILQYSNIERYKEALKAQKSYKSSGVSYPPSEKWDRWSSQFLI